jgi:hypothetical protein
MNPVDNFAEAIAHLRPDCQNCSLPFQEALASTKSNVDDLDGMGEWPASLAGDQERIRAKLEARHGWALLNMRCFVILASACEGTSVSDECQRSAQQRS